MSLTRLVATQVLPQRLSWKRYRVEYLLGEHLTPAQIDALGETDDLPRIPHLFILGDGRLAIAHRTVDGKITGRWATRQAEDFTAASR